MATPRKKARMRASAPTVFPERRAGAPALIRPRLREYGLIDIWFHDRRGRKAPERYMEYWRGERKLTGDMITRATNHYDNNKIDRINGYNRMLLIFFIR